MTLDSKSSDLLFNLTSPYLPTVLEIIKITLNFTIFASSENKIEADVIRTDERGSFVSVQAYLKLDPVHTINTTSI